VPQPSKKSHLSEDALAVTSSVLYVFHCNLFAVPQILTEVDSAIGSTTKLFDAAEVRRKFSVSCHSNAPKSYKDRVTILDHT
jgi:hypothetical protein